MPALCRPACPEVPSETMLRRGACFNWRNSRRGQQVIEYALFIAVIGLVLTVMYMYSKRGLQAVIKAGADQIGTQESSQPLAGQVYTNSISTSDTLSEQNANMKKVNEDKYTQTQSISSTTGTGTTVVTNY